MAKKLADFVREARSKISEWDAQTLQSHLNDPELLILDIREPDEYAAGHLPRALLVPRGTLEGAADPNYKHRVEPLCSTRSRPVVTYCQSGGRSAMAAATLKEMGFENVYSLSGGYENWEADELPVER